MIRLAISMLVRDRLKYLGLVLGLAFSSFLVTQQASIFTGFARRTGAWVREVSGVDLWVMDPQMQFSDDPKRLLDKELSRVRSVPGVDWAVPILKTFATIRLPDGTLVDTQLVGIDDASLVGAPPRFVEGTLEDMRRDRALVVEASACATDLRLKTGLPGEGPRALRVDDRVTIGDREMLVTATYARSKAFFWQPVLYTTYRKALDLVPSQRRILTFILAGVRPGRAIDDVAREVGRATGLKAVTPAAFEETSMWFLLEFTGILVNFGITIVLGIVIGVLVSALLLYTFVLDNLRHYGTLKAMGTSNPRLVGMVAIQALWAGVVGYGIGLGAAALSGILLQKATENIAFELRWQVMVGGAALTLVCCLLGALASVLRVTRLEPSMVFRA
jgi:putative ABC transport system permease protein